MSKAEVIFKLHGEGEEAKYLWNTYFKNGKCVFTAQGVVVYPKPDLNSL